MFENIEFTEVLDEPKEITLEPARIDFKAYLDIKRGWINKNLAVVKDLTPETIAATGTTDLRRIRAEINSSINEIDSERKAIKRVYNEPLKRFESDIKEILEPARVLEKTLGSEIAKRVEYAREQRRFELEKTYSEFCELNGVKSLPELIPFEKIIKLAPRAMEKAVSLKKAAAEIEDVAAGVLKDWKILQSQKATIPFFSETEAKFFETLSLSKALEFNAEKQKEFKKIEAVKSDRDEVNNFRDCIPSRCRYRLEADFTDDEIDALRNWKNAQNIGENWTIKKVER